MQEPQNRIELPVVSANVSELTLLPQVLGREYSKVRQGKAM
jgi:hypothetical protein